MKRVIVFLFIGHTSLLGQFSAGIGARTGYDTKHESVVFGTQLNLSIGRFSVVPGYEYMGAQNENGNSLNF